MKEEIFQKVKEFIAGNNHIPAEEITLDSSFEELNMDSLDGITLINDLENHYKIILTNEEATGIKTVREAVEALDQKLAQQ
ncbi:MAG: acyl carrier protein [Chitinophagaceae bacterium]|nr:acyl carrier protein [Chitinophagaceae bacterium]